MTKLKQAQLQAQFLKQNESLKGSSSKLFKRPLSFADSNVLNRLRRRTDNHSMDQELLDCKKQMDVSGTKFESST